MASGLEAKSEVLEMRLKSNQIGPPAIFKTGVVKELIKISRILVKNVEALRVRSNGKIVDDRR